jgi:hypothetical protein
MVAKVSSIKYVDVPTGACGDVGKNKRYKPRRVATQADNVIKIGQCLVHMLWMETR